MTKEDARQQFIDFIHARGRALGLSALGGVEIADAADEYVDATLGDTLGMLERAAKLTDVVEVQWDIGAERFYYTAYGTRCSRAEAEALLKAQA